MMKSFPILSAVIIAGLLVWSLASLFATSANCDGAVVMAVDFRTNPYICIEGK